MSYNLTIPPHGPCTELTTAFLTGLGLSWDAEAFVAPSLSLGQVNYCRRPLTDGSNQVPVSSL